MDWDKIVEENNLDKVLSPFAEIAATFTGMYRTIKQEMLDEGCTIMEAHDIAVGSVLMMCCANVPKRGEA